MFKTKEAKGLKCDILHLQQSKLRDFLLLLQNSIEFYGDSIKNSESHHWYICLFPQNRNILHQKNKNIGQKSKNFRSFLKTVYLFVYAL